MSVRRALLAAAAVAGIACPAPTPRDPRNALPQAATCCAEEATTGALPLEIEVIPDPLRPAPLFSFSAPLYQLDFHLNLHNRGDRELELLGLSLAFRRGDRTLACLALGQGLLASRLRAAPITVLRDRQSLAVAARTRPALLRPKGDARIAPGETVSLVHQLSLHRTEELPDRIACRVVGRAGSTPGRATRELGVLELQQRTRLSLPFTGRWWVMGTHRFDEDHAEAAVASQRFAYDLGVLGAELVSYRGDPRRNASYLASGRPILAAADGEVVAVHDGVAENDPVGSRPSWREVQRRPEDLAGNFVVLRHEGDEHTAYLHLQPGLKLRRGVRVRRGERVGSCGNSGNSRESHLHIQLQDGPDPLRARALPPRFGDFTIFLGGLRLYVSPTRPQPLPSGAPIEPGRAEGSSAFPP